jgi:hypothetical protein
MGQEIIFHNDENAITLSSALHEILLIDFYPTLDSSNTNMFYNSFLDKLIKVQQKRCDELRSVYYPNFCDASIDNLRNNSCNLRKCEPNLWFSESKKLSAVSLGSIKNCFIFLPPNFYWSSLAKSSIINYAELNYNIKIREIVSIPATRIRQISQLKDNIGFDYPFIVLSFLTVTNKIDVMHIAKIINDEILTRASKKDTFLDRKIEIFLTFSTLFPIIIKHEYLRFNEITQTKCFRKMSGIESSSSLVLLNSNSKYPIATEECQLKLNIKYRAVELAQASMLESFLTEQGVEIYEAPKQRVGHWDSETIIKSKNLFETYSAIENFARKNYSIIEDFIIFPLFDSFDKFELPTKSVAAIGSQPELKEDTKVNALIDNNEIYFSHITSVSPTKPERFFKGNESQAVQEIFSQLNVLSTSLYEAKFDAEFIYHSIFQIKRLWEAQLKTIAINTLKLTVETIKKNIDNIFLLICLYHDWLKNELTIEDEQEADWLFSRIPKWQESLHINFWEPLAEIENINTILNQVLVLLTNEFQFRKEGKQLSLLSFPISGPAQRTGISDIMLSSFHRLARDYFPIFKIDQNQLSDVVRKAFRDFFCWKGLVTAQIPPGVEPGATRKNFWIHPLFEIIYLPTEIRLHLRHKLIPLSHEIGHLLLDKIESIIANYRSYPHPFFGDTCINLEIHGTEIFKNIITPLISIDRVFVKFGNELKKEENESLRLDDYEIREIFCDILGFFIGGPFLFLSFARFGYAPKFYDKIHSQIKYNTFSWLRMKLGLSICDCFDIDKDWKHPIKIAISKIESCEKKESIDIALKIWASLIEKGLESKLNEIRFLLYRYFEKDSLFFPDLSKSKEIFSRCKTIADRIGVGSEIVVDERPKYIAAASVISPLERPFYPSGHIFQSLHYTKNIILIRN